MNASAGRPIPWRAIEKALVVAVALHSYAVGFFLLFFTRWGARFGGWGEVSPLFFARQAGIFHFVVASGYLIEYFRARGVSLLLLAKATATVFLVAMMLEDGGPWVLPLSALGDALMGLAVWIAHRKASQA
ncbi:MAG TPA: hypothetical protein VF425_00770 [Thermoanaerobaculia bacterium]